MNYYYISNTKEKLDLLGVIRKIRTNRLKKYELLATDAQTSPQEAYQYPELYDIFAEQDRILQEEIDSVTEPKQGIMTLLKNAVITLKDDMSSAAITGTLIIIIMSIIGGTALKLPSIIAAFVAPIICYFLFNLCIIAHLRLSRVQLLSVNLMMQICKKHGKSLLLAAIIPAIFALTLPWIISEFMGWKTWIFASIFSVTIIAYFLYLPVIIFDREVNFKQALSINHHAIADYGASLLVPIIILLLINIIAGPFILLTLPITLLTVMHLYDEYFTEY